jgi:chitinase
MIMKVKEYLTKWKINIKGLMTWSINWDNENNYDFRDNFIEFINDN